MSKFFDETRNVQREQSATTASANLNIHELVGSLKQKIDGNGSGNGSGTAHAEAAELKHLLKPLKETQAVSSELAAGRLEKCATIRLPRTEEKSFLVTQYNPQMQTAVEAYRTLRTRLVKQQTKNGTRSLVVSSAGEGEGKTLTTFNLALCYANIQNWPVLAVDADLRTRGLSQLIGDPESPGLSGILEGSCSFAAAVLKTDIPGLCVLPAGETMASSAELFASHYWKEFIGWASETFRMVVVDSPPALHLSDFELIAAQCESVMLVVRSRRTKRDSFAKILGQVETKKLAGVVFNASEDTTGYDYGYHYGSIKNIN